MTEWAWLLVAVVYGAGQALHSTGALDRLSAALETDEGSTPIDDVHQRYLDGEIDENELERRLEVLVDDRAATIRDMADDVDGIGEELSRDLAREFDSVADLRGADAEDLQRVEGIGEMRAERLREKLS
ncbi:helix-hairpin-helix domain-containing protein [Haloarcula laminariae]|uniref:helix-hairpin-helix domain-containing protein n=1 Tax=Haloarcula laminariae TaxID=2961577 RepID=UPI002404C7FB|nr:helix-hairpin-helix domain-containing protein [Halomicroarcula sp. FL173]